MKMVITIIPGDNGFAEDKDSAKKIRLEIILPALERSDEIILDFTGVTSTTQSFIHALIGETLKRYGEDVLDRISFHHCNPQVQSIVSLVVDYSLGGFEAIEDEKPKKN